MILLLLLSNTLFSQQIPDPVKMGDRFVFYGAATKSVRSDKSGNETKLPLITVPFGTNRSIASNKQHNNQINKQRPASPAAAITLATTVIQPSCGYNNGSIVVVASGSKPPIFIMKQVADPKIPATFPCAVPGFMI